MCIRTYSGIFNLFFIHSIIYKKCFVALDRDFHLNLFEINKLIRIYFNVK